MDYNVSTLNNSTEETTQELIEDYIATKCWQIFSPILLIFGVFGNILVIQVLHRMRFTRSSTLMHLFVLAICDMCVLVTGLSRYWINNVFDVDIRGLSDIGCKVHLFVIYASMDYSSWILVSVTIERFISVYFPLKSRRMVSVSRTRIILVVIFCLVALVNCHFFWTNGLTDDGCGSLTPYDLYFDEYIFVWIDFVVLSLLPFTIMLVCNITIVKILMKSRRQQNDLVGSPNNGKRGKITSTTRMLMLVNAFFLLTTLPISVFFITDSFMRREDTVVNAKLDLAWAITYLFQYANYALNFYLYCARGRRFRNELLLLLRCQKGRYEPSTVWKQNHPSFTSQYKLSSSPRMHVRSFRSCSQLTTSNQHLNDNYVPLKSASYTHINHLTVSNGNALY